MGNYHLYLIAYWITRAMPRKMAYAFARALADCHYFLSKQDRLAVESNLKKVYKTEDLPSGVVRNVFRNFGRYLADFFTQTKYLDSDFITHHVHLHNIEYINDVLSQKKGCIIVSAHLGNWELAGAVLAKLGYPLSIVALPHQDPKVNQFFNAQREFFGTTVIPTTTAIRRCLEHLRDNRLLAILAERDFTQHGIPMDFFGYPTMIPKGAAIFSLRTGAPIIPAFFIRTQNDDYDIELLKPIYPPVLTKAKYSDSDMVDMMRQYVSIIEQEIRKHPDQWLIFRKFEI